MLYNFKKIGVGLNAKYFLGVLLVFNIYWLVLLYNSFLLTILLASLFAIATSSLYNKVTQFTRSEFLGAFISSLALALIFFAPIGYFIYQAINFVSNIRPSDLELFTPSIEQMMSYVPSYFDFARADIREFLISINITQMEKDLLKYLISIFGESMIFFKDSFLIIIFYFFIQFYRNKLIRYFKRIIPFSTQDTVALFKEISVVMGTVFYSIVVNASLQGFLFAIVVFYYGYNPLLFGILYGFASLIPVIGGMLMWLPILIYESSTGNIINGIVIMVYSIVVIAFFADTIVKPAVIRYIHHKVMNSQVNANELLIFFSMIAGLSSFGFWGMILGPAIITLFLSLIKLYEKLYNKNDSIFKMGTKYKGNGN
jgi:predicted PurR-regulated permease PerM